MIVLLQEWVAVEANSFVGDSIRADEVSDGLRDQEHNLQRLDVNLRSIKNIRGTNHSWKDVCQRAGQLKHNDYNCDCHPHDTAE